MKFRTLICMTMLAAANSLSHAVDLKPYSMPAVQEAQQAGKPYAIHFHAAWCSTCRAQTKAFQSLKNDKDVDLAVFVADYDKEKDLKQQLNIRTQSTLVVFRGMDEKARLAGETDDQKLKAALKKAL